MEIHPVEFKISHATLSDVGRMALVLQRANAFRDGVPMLDVVNDLEKLTKLETLMEYPNYWAYLAEDNNGLAGFVLGHPSAFEKTIKTEEDVDYLALLMVDPRNWGRGIGRSLLDRAAEGATNADKEHLALWTAVGNARARKLYENNGYYLTHTQRKSELRGFCEQYKLDLI